VVTAIFRKTAFIDTAVDASVSMARRTNGIADNLNTVIAA
jgi:hypothetical protein